VLHSHYGFNTALSTYLLTDGRDGVRFAPLRNGSADSDPRPRLKEETVLPTIETMTYESDVVRHLGPLAELREYATEQRDAARKHDNRAGALAFDDVIKKVNELERETIKEGVPLQFDLLEFGPC
jgi:hypothetical protein